MVRRFRHENRDEPLHRPEGGTGLLFAVVVGGGMALAAAPIAEAASDDPLEAAVKATYLYKFTAFVAWPDSAFAGPDSPFVLCVEGEDPFGDLLDRAVTGQSVGGHPVALRRQPRFTGGSGCHLLYTAAPADRPRGEPVLTITDSARGGARGAVITFVLQDDRVRFEIDADAARDNRLSISSKLMSLAVGTRR